PLLPWNTIDTVLLDMDGTLLDLHFDNHFWLEHLPQRYAERHGISRAMADRELQPLFARHAGQLAWYCLDFWSRELDLPIVELKREVAHLISLRPDADVFLDALRRAGKRVALITNAHRDSLDRKSTRLNSSHVKISYAVFCSPHHRALPSFPTRRSSDLHAGQLAWYCLDFWSRELDLPIVELKREVAHLISLRPDADVFLDALRRAGKRVALITNAHRDS